MKRLMGINCTNILRCSLEYTHEDLYVLYDAYPMNNALALTFSLKFPLLLSPDII